MTMEERNASRANREDKATNGGTTSPNANNVSNSAMTADPKAMNKNMPSKTRAERKAERDAKRMGTTGSDTQLKATDGTGIAKP